MISLLGLIAIFIATYYIYKTAKDTNRNAVGWALLTVAIGLGLQVILPLVIFLVIAIAMTISGRRLNDVDELPWSLSTIISLSGIPISFIGIWLIMRRVSTIREEESFNAPPAPPTFDGK